MMTSHSEQHEISLYWEGKAVGINKKQMSFIRKGHSRIYTNREYLDFKKSMAYTWKSNTFLGPPIIVNIALRVSAGRDIDSLVKPILDAIELAGIYKNDNEIVHFCVDKQTKKRGEKDIIFVEVIGDLEKSS